MNRSEKDRIRHYIKGSTGHDEDFVASSFLNDENEEELKGIALEQWKNASSAHIDLQHVLHRIYFRINSKSVSSTHPLTKRVLQIYSRIAAILLIPLFITGIFLGSRQPDQAGTFAEIKAPQGSRVQFTLPDGSKGYLNSGSTLQYPTAFMNNRSVMLTGEAYFEVAKNKKHPFTVQTGHADVQALGTRFDVCAYPDEHQLTTTLEEGSVRIFNKTTNTPTTLCPGEQNRINTADGKMINLKVKTQLYTSWKEEILRFDNAPFAEVVKKMERWYGVKIILDKRLPYPDNYTLSIKTESLREMLQLLSITTPINYKIEKDTVFINQPTKKKPMDD